LLATVGILGGRSAGLIARGAKLHELRPPEKGLELRRDRRRDVLEVGNPELPGGKEEREMLRSGQVGTFPGWPRLSIFSSSPHLGRGSIPTHLHRPRSPIASNRVRTRVHDHTDRTKQAVTVRRLNVEVTRINPKAKGSVRRADRGEPVEDSRGQAGACAAQPTPRRSAAPVVRVSPVRCFP